MLEECFEKRWCYSTAQCNWSRMMKPVLHSSSQCVGWGPKDRAVCHGTRQHAGLSRHSLTRGERDKAKSYYARGGMHGRSAVSKTSTQLVNCQIPTGIWHILVAYLPHGRFEKCDPYMPANFDLISQNWSSRFSWFHDCSPLPSLLGHVIAIVY